MPTPSLSLPLARSLTHSLTHWATGCVRVPLPAPGPRNLGSTHKLLADKAHALPVRPATLSLSVRPSGPHGPPPWTSPSLCLSHSPSHPSVPSLSLSLSLSLCLRGPRLHSLCSTACTPTALLIEADATSSQLAPARRARTSDIRRRRASTSCLSSAALPHSAVSWSSPSQVPDTTTVSSRCSPSA